MLRSEIEVPETDPATLLARELPRLVRAAAEADRKAATERLISVLLSLAAGIAIGTLGKKRAYELIERQLRAVDLV
jgi:hypothetical protein